MSIYVDSLKTYNKNVGKLHIHTWCHMWADSIEELHMFAKTLGLKREWFQDHIILPHYDLTPNKRNIAIEKGAYEMSQRELYNELQKRKEHTK